MHSYTGKTLRCAGRHIKLPFSLILGGSEDVLRCEQLLKIVPKRRGVLFGRWGSKPVLAKLFYRLFHIHRHLQREIKGSRAILKAGIPTPELLYAGKTDNSSVGILLFEYIHPIRPLLDVWNTLEGPKEKLVLFRRLIGIIAKMHQAGLKQRDLHLNNFFIHNNEIYAIDGASVKQNRTGYPLRKKESLNNLGLLFAQLTIQDCSIISNLYTEYIKIRGWDNSVHIYKDLQVQTERQRKWRLKKYYGRKLFRETDKVICRRSFTHFMLCMRSDYSPIMARFLDSPDRVLSSSNSQLLKKDDLSEEFRVKIDHQEFVVKKYNEKGVYNGVLPCFWTTRAAHSWQNTHRDFALSHAAPRPVALLEKRFGPFCGTSFFISKFDSKPSNDLIQPPPALK